MNMSPLQRKFVIKQRIYSISVTLSRLILFLGFIGIWEFTADKGIINAFIFSSPVRLYQTFMDLAKDGVIFMHIWVTLYETIVAFAIITVVGIIFAILLWCFKGLSDCLEPFMVVLNSLPKSALAPMLIVWLGTNTKAIIITAVSVAIFGMIINLYTGFLGIDKEKITLIRTLGGNKWHILCKLIIPGSKKIIISNMKVRLYQTFMDLAKDGVIFMHIWVTLYETIVAFAIITVVGIIFAILLWCFKGLSDCLEPFMVVLNSLPKSALAPMLIVWLGTNTKAIIITAVSVAIFGMIINLYTGFLGIDKEKITLIRTLGGNKWHILCKLIIPGSKKIIISNMKVNIGLCLVGVIIGEFLAAKKGLGYLIIYGSQVFKMSYVVLGIVILCIISTILFALINIIQKLFLKD